MKPDSQGTATMLAAALPQLVLDIEDSLIRLGRGSVADQLRQASVESWDYDQFADVAVLHLRTLPQSGDVERGVIQLGHGETISLQDDLPVNVEIDDRGRLVNLEVFDAGAILPQLKAIASR